MHTLSERRYSSELGRHFLRAIDLLVLKQLFTKTRLHLGIYFDNPDKIDVKDCVSDEFFAKFRDTSHQNTNTYDGVFKCLPSDKILTFDNLANYTAYSCLSKSNPIKGREELSSKVKGFIVDFPLKFLSKEKNFFPEFNTPEGMVPTAMWT
jgi:hypothetical protein